MNEKLLRFMEMDPTGGQLFLVLFSILIAGVMLAKLGHGERLYDFRRRKFYRALRNGDTSVTPPIFIGENGTEKVHPDDVAHSHKVIQEDEIMSKLFYEQ